MWKTIIFFSENPQHFAEKKWKQPISLFGGVLYVCVCVYSKMFCYMSVKANVTLHLLVGCVRAAEPPGRSYFP